MSQRKSVVSFLAFLASTVASAQSPLATLHSFSGTDGSQPDAALIRARDGNLYGTTFSGGASLYYGTVFRISPSGALTTLYSFCAQSGCPDGAGPSAGLVQASNGDLYGTTSSGGANGSYGTVFKITPSGALTTLYSFCSQGYPCTDGWDPMAALAESASGNLYGTTFLGGANSGGANGGGTVFQITPSGALTTLYTFCSPALPHCPNGANPNTGLIQGNDGSLYGPTLWGGNRGEGTIFKITPGGSLTKLYSFCPQGSHCASGRSPSAALVQASDGNLYGTTPFGGANNNGTIFKITPSGALTTLYRFCSLSGCPDGARPYASLVRASDGSLYGTTYYGGMNGGGTIFKITPGGALTTLYSFCSMSACADGQYPYAGLIQVGGNLYGTTSFGGSSNNGTVFRLSLGLPTPALP